MPSTEAKRAAVLQEIALLNGFYTTKLQPASARVQHAVASVAYSANHVQQIIEGVVRRAEVPGVVSFIGPDARVVGASFASLMKAALSQALVNVAKAKMLLRPSDVDVAYASLTYVRRLRTSADGVVLGINRVLDAAEVVSPGMALWPVVAVAIVAVVVSAGVLLFLFEKMKNAQIAERQAQIRCEHLATQGMPCDYAAAYADALEQQTRTGITGLARSTGDAITSIAPDVGSEVASFLSTGKIVLVGGAIALGGYLLWTTLPAATVTRENLRARATAWRRSR